jgi:hypothetical protein
VARFEPLDERSGFSKDGDSLTAWRPKTNSKTAKETTRSLS